MSTASTAASTTAPTDDLRIDVSGTPRVPFWRLVGVETRKMTDTRAGRWLIGITVGLLILAVAVAVLVATLNDLTLSFGAWQDILSFPMSLLLPTIAIISITQEWGQRTSLVTFALEPHRMRVVAAKLVSVLLMAVATILIAIVAAAAGNLLFEVFSGRDAGWSVDERALGWAIYTQLAYFIMAFGAGMVFLNTPAAIVLYYAVALLLPMFLYGPLYGLVSWGPDVVPWLDLGFAIAPFTSDDVERPDNALLQVVFTTFLWVVVPAVVGMLRVRRIELK